MSFDELNDTMIKELIILLSIWVGICEEINLEFREKTHIARYVLWHDQVWRYRQALVSTWIEACDYVRNIFSYPNEACWQRHRPSKKNFFWKMDVLSRGDRRWINYEEMISLMSLIAIQAYMMLYMMQGWRVGTWERVSRNWAWRSAIGLCRGTNARVLGSTWRILVIYGFHFCKYQSFLEYIVKMVIWTRSEFHSKIKI